MPDIREVETMLERKIPTISVEEIQVTYDYCPDTGQLWTRYCPDLGLWRQRRRLGYAHHSGYRYVTIGASEFLEHRVIWAWWYGEWPGDIIDHINGARADNKITNLRTASSSQNNINSANRRDANPYGRGVSYDPRYMLWCARIQVNGVRHFIGSFRRPEDAVTARTLAAAQYHGNYRRNDNP